MCLLKACLNLLFVCSAWVGTNGAAPKGAKQTTKDVEAYFKINDVKKLVL